MIDIIGGSIWSAPLNTRQQSLNVTENLMSSMWLHFSQPVYQNEDFEALVDYGVVIVVSKGK